MVNDQSVPSFVPKQEDKNIARKNINRIRSYLNAAIFIGVSLFALAVAAAVFSYLFRSIAEDRLAKSQASLAEARDEFNPDQIAELNRFNDRLQTVDSLLSQHRRLSPLFEEIQDYTLVTVQLKSASVTYNDDDSITITGSGESLDFESLALQSDEFTKEGSKISNPIFTNFQKNDEGLVSFQYSFKVSADVTKPFVDDSVTDNPDDDNLEANVQTP